MTERLDYALSNAGVVSLAFGGEMFDGRAGRADHGKCFPEPLGQAGDAPAFSIRKKHRNALYLGHGTIIWIVAAYTVDRRLDRSRRGRAKFTARPSRKFGTNLPHEVFHFFLKQVRTWSCDSLSTRSWPKTPDADLPAFLAERIQSIPYFSQLIVLDLQI